ncbi:MAG: glycosyltransferase family 4 protein [Bacillota bacterium]
MKIIFFTKYDHKGASSRYRTMQFLDYFRRHDVLPDYFPLFDNHYLDLFYSGNRIPMRLMMGYFIRRFFHLFKVTKYDLVVIEKELFPYFPALFEVIFKIFNIKYILDYDDAIFHNYDLNKKKVIRLFLRNKIPLAMKYATGIIAGSPYLFDFASRYNNNVYLIPTVVDLKKYHNRIPVRSDNKNFIIGWIGSKSTSINIIDIKKSLEFICAKYTDVCIHLIGFDKSLENQLTSINYKLINWDEESEINELEKISVGIMPLTDTPWNRGKCGFKLIQYMACEKPIIASAVGVNKSIVDQNINGFLCTDSSDWITAFEFMINNEEKRIEFGNNGFNKVKEMYCVKAVYAKYLEIFNKTARVSK